MLCTAIIRRSPSKRAWVRFATDRSQILGRQQVTGRTAERPRDCRHGMRPSAAIDEQQTAIVERSAVVDKPKAVARLSSASNPSSGHLR